MNELTLEAFQTGSKDEWIDEIMNAYGQQILQLVFSYVKNKDTAEDLTQEIFVKCYKALDTYNGKAKVKTWLWRIAINHCKDFLKSWYTKHVVITAERDENGTKKEMVEQTVIQQEEDDELISAILELPIQYREVIYLHYYEELPIKEVALMTEINENTVKTRLRRAKQLLKNQLEG